MILGGLDSHKSFSNNNKYQDMRRLKDQGAELVEEGSLVYGKALEWGHDFYKAFGSTWVWGSIPCPGPLYGPGMGPCL